jgi:outer membrane receptor protein involved in Fe transport
VPRRNTFSYYISTFCTRIREQFCVAGALLLATFPAWSAAGAPDAPLEEIVVTASLRPEALGAFPVSTTVLDSAVLQAAGSQHLQDALGLVPNLSWSGGTSRPRFYLLRGVGELEQYQGAPNPSVGFLIDDIDFSGVGMPASTFDVEQVEVLRGPQGTRYGANALAGLINIRTRDPRPEPQLDTELTAGDDGTFGVGLVAGGALGDAATERGAWRFAAEQAQSDGFRRNVYLGRDDTNGRDELTLRGKLALQPAPGWQLMLSVLYADFDNGFDAFSTDNSFDTRSDRPGRDAQASAGTALRIVGDLGTTTLRATTAYADSDIVYSFDGDWGNDAYWGEFAPYDYFSRYDRERRTLSQDLRWLSKASAREDGFGWLAGVYALRLTEDNRQRDEFAGELLRPELDANYEAVSAAAYGEAEWLVGRSLVLSSGLRVETRSADYEDSDGAAFAPRDTMLGGHLSLTGEWHPRGTWYVTASRGYKAGGFNIGAFVPDDRREFEPEYLWNLETGLRHASDDGTLSAELALFYMWRESQQVATSFQLDPGDPLSYVFFTDNAARGRNSGIEASVAWRPLEAVTLGATLGLLHSEYLDYRYGDRDLDGREQAHAPGYQYSLSAEWNAGRGWMARADVTGSDDFYFDASHDQQSQPYALVNLKAGYAADRWAVYAWARNAFDERFAVRGFYFGLEPPDFANKLYVQQGDPRRIGVTVTWSLR